MNINLIHFKYSSRMIPLILVVVLSGAASLSLVAQPIVTSNPSNNKAVPLIALKGDGYQRGLQHGKILKKEIAEVYAKWKENIRSVISGDPDSALSVFLKSTHFIPAIEKNTPEMILELRGIAAGSGQTFEDVYAFQLVDEYWVYLDKQKNTENHHCSGIGFAGNVNHPAYIAQNMDLENYMNGFQVLFYLEARADEPEQYILSCAGLVALNGVNSQGIALCMNTLMELEASTDGLPVAFMIRGVLSKMDGNDALNFLKTVKHASGQNYILGIQDSVYDFEASANQVVRFLPETSNHSIVYHTNHALANHDVKDWYKAYHQQLINEGIKGNNSEIRFASLQHRLNKASTNISVDLIKSTLRSKDDPKNPVCRSFSENGRAFTFSSVVFTLSTIPSIQLTYGSPDQSAYKEYFFMSVR